MEFIEVSAKTVNEAITNACMKLSLPSDRLEIEVITEGSTGFLGFGSKPAVIRVYKKDDIEAQAREEALRLEAEKKAAEEAKKAEAAKAAKAAEAAKAEKCEKPAAKEPKKAEGKKNKKAPKPEKKAEKTEEVKPSFEEKREVPVKTDEEIAAMKEEAMKFLTGTFKAMGIEAVIKMDYDKEEGSLDASFEGEDMGVLIGKRGQTLDSLQYLTSLVVNKGQKDYIRVKLDTEDYRKRRKDTLENLAKNIANKVKKTRKTVVLEPMNPYERRIIHSVLHNNKAVETFSEGNEPYRHIVVKPSKQK